MRRAAVLGSMALAAAALPTASCRGPTELTVALTTDVPCGTLHGTSVTVGHVGDVETKAATTSSTACDVSGDASGDLGALVVVPSGGTDEEVAIKIVAGVGKDADACVAPTYGKGCIVARRQIHYVPHANLHIVVPLRASCDGVPCDPTTTCVNGACVTAQIVDPGPCTSGDGCGEGVLAPTATDGGGGDAVSDAPADAAVCGGTDARADAGPDGTAGDAGPVAYRDVTNTTFWSAVDLSPLGAAAQRFSGTVFDGRYMYFVPNGFGAFARYDTQGAFGAMASWTLFTPTGVPASFAGAVFDGRYVYFAAKASPYVVLRYDTKAPFDVAGSWTAYATAIAYPMLGAVLGGTSVYFLSSVNGVVTKYDTNTAFTAAASWSTFDVGAPSGGGVFAGGVFDGRYVYPVPNDFTAPIAIRYDSQAPFTTQGSWTWFDTTTIIGAQSKGFFGGLFDGSHVYFAPFDNPNPFGLVAMYDTSRPFDVAASWATFDTTTVSPSAYGFSGTAFDGRYAYFLPGYNGKVARYDTKAAFGQASSWAVFDTTAVQANLSSMNGGGFDGRYVYFTTGSAILGRFEARDVGGGPIPAGGSFL